MAQLHKGRRLMGEINVVPYIDVMLVLLIIFMVTAPLLAQGVKVDLPKASAEPLPPDAQEPLVLSIDKQGRMYLNVGATPNAPIEEEVVLARTAAALRRTPEKPVLLKADEAIAYGRAVDAMVILQRAGATKVGFITEPLADRKPYGAQPSADTAAAVDVPRRKTAGSPGGAASAKRPASASAATSSVVVPATSAAGPAAVTSTTKG